MYILQSFFLNFCLKSIYFNFRPPSPAQERMKKAANVETLSVDDDDDEPLAVQPSTSRSLPTTDKSTKPKEVDYVTLEDSDDDEAMIVPPAGIEF